MGSYCILIPPRGNCWSPKLAEADFWTLMSCCLSIILSTPPVFPCSFCIFLPKASADPTPRPTPGPPSPPSVCREQELMMHLHTSSTPGQQKFTNRKIRCCQTTLPQINGFKENPQQALPLKTYFHSSERRMLWKLQLRLAPAPA